MVPQTPTGLSQLPQCAQQIPTSNTLSVNIPLSKSPGKLAHYLLAPTVSIYLPKNILEHRTDAQALEKSEIQILLKYLYIALKLPSFKSSTQTNKNP